MGRFKEYLKEAKHHLKDVGEWGVVTHDGEHIRGTSHPVANSHVQLGGTQPVEYFQDHMSDEHEDGALAIRTHSTHGVKLAIKHFDSFPHYRHGMVVHEHSGYQDSSKEGGSVGKRYAVLAKMKKMVGEP